MKSLSEIIYHARQLMSQPFTVNHPFSPGFIFKPTGRLAYELVLDVSGSMEASDYPPSRFAAAKKAAIGFLQKCAEQTPDALVGVVFYGSEATVAARLLPARSHQDQLLRAIEDGEIAGSTDIPSGLLAAGNEFVAGGAGLNPAIVLLTDGHSNSGTDPVGAATQLKRAGIRLDIIGIGGSPSQVNEHELKQMASVFEGQLRYWFIRDNATLVRKFEALALGKV